MESLLCFVGLNPAYQKTLVFPNFRVGQVNRAQELRIAVGGKGQHGFLAARRWLVMRQNPKLQDVLKDTVSQSKGEACLIQFVGGHTGDHVVAVTDSDGHQNISIRTAADTRTCTTMICDKTNQVTEVIDPSGTVSPSELQDAEKQLKGMLTSSRVRGLCIMGTCPPGVPESFYADAVRSTPARSQCIVLLDGYRGVQPTLATKRVDVLKVNLKELCLLAGMEDVDEVTSSDLTDATKTDVAQRRSALDATKTDVAQRRSALARRAASAVFAQYEVGWIAITDGAASAYLFRNESSSGGPQHPSLEKTADAMRATDEQKERISHVEYHWPIPEKIVNPIGAGDTVAAVFMAEVHMGQPAHEAFRRGLAVATASCLHPQGANFNLEDAVHRIPVCQATFVTDAAHKDHK